MNYEIRKCRDLLHTFYSVLERKRSAGVVIKGNPDKLWILGGHNLGEAGGSSEFIYLNGTIEDGPTIEGHDYNHCAVQSNSSQIFIMGGTKNSKGVTVYHPENNTITTQLDMNFDRKVSSCTVFQSAKHGNREVIFIGGGSGSVQTAEILDYSMTETWEQGKDIFSCLEISILTIYSSSFTF